MGGQERVYKYVTGSTIRYLRVGTRPVQTALFVKGQTLGHDELVLGDVDGKKDRFEVVVRRELAVPVTGTYDLQHPSGKPIKSFVVDSEKVIRPKILAGDKKTLRLEVPASGETQLQLTDVDGKTETFQVFARTTKVLLVEGESQKLEMSKKQPIDEIVVERPTFLRVVPDKDTPTAFTITALAAGAVRITLRVYDANLQAFTEEETVDIGIKPKK
jgi:hypothetical protein